MSTFFCHLILISYWLKNCTPLSFGFCLHGSNLIPYGPQKLLKRIYFHIKSYDVMGNLGNLFAKVHLVKSCAKKVRSSPNQNVTC